MYIPTPLALDSHHEIVLKHGKCSLSALYKYNAKSELEFANIFVKSRSNSSKFDGTNLGSVGYLFMKKESKTLMLQSL